MSPSETQRLNGDAPVVLINRSHAQPIRASWLNAAGKNLLSWEESSRFAFPMWFRCTSSTLCSFRGMRSYASAMCSSSLGSCEVESFALRQGHQVTIPVHARTGVADQTYVGRWLTGTRQSTASRKQLLSRLGLQGSTFAALIFDPAIRAHVLDSSISAAP